MKYAIIVTSGEAKNFRGELVTALGTKFWVTNEPDGWVDATSRRVDSVFLDGGIPTDVKTFDTELDAVLFARLWSGHPWWCVPSGDFEIAVLEPKYKTVIDGYVRVK